MSEVKGHTADELQVRGGACDLRRHPAPLGQALREGGARRGDAMLHRLQERERGGRGDTGEGERGADIPMLTFNILHIMKLTHRNLG